MAEAEIAIVRIAPETSFKNKAYEALKEAILKMDIYATPEQVMLDERALSERLGVSRTFQLLQVFPQLSARDNLILAGQEHRGHRAHQSACRLQHGRAHQGAGR